ncbi:MAG TPA: oligopeptide ABC transporter ATP-binding protein [Chloroflexi bacterium]|nr:oligopeptide ABC transporter ATP-binding protein [Chloroflexota bacterium]
MDNASKNNGTPLLSLKNLHVWFELKRWGFAHAGYVRAVDDVSFDLHRGDAIAIVGESGSGKTSLMKTILGINRPIKGDIFFDGQSLSELNPRQLREFRSKIGFVQQDPYGALPPFMSVRRILSEPLIINGIKDPDEREERIRKVMSEVKLNPVDDFIEKFPHMLSGGQQQRVVIARAMILGPKLIVADEPVSMLDASVRVEILKLLENLQHSHDLAVIYITHDLSTVRYFSERIFVMYAGQLIEKSSVDGILSNHLHPYTDALLKGTSEPDANNAKIFKEVPPGEPPSLVNPPKGCRFHPRCAKMIDGLCNVEDPPEFEPAEPGHLTFCWLYKQNGHES